MSKFYTLTFKHERLRKKVVIKHCIKFSDDLYLRPMKYANGSPEREPVEDIEEDIGMDYEPINLERSGYRLVKEEPELDLGV